jgi:hypothetical protein
LAGTSVTVSGSTFGASQGSGQVWLGTALAVVTLVIVGASTVNVMLFDDTLP